MPSDSLHHHFMINVIKQPNNVVLNHSLVFPAPLSSDRYRINSWSIWSVSVGFSYSLQKPVPCSWSLNAGSYLTSLIWPSPIALNTATFDYSTRGWFGTCTWMLVPEGLPPSLTKHDKPCCWFFSFLKSRLVFRTHIDAYLWTKTRSFGFMIGTSLAV